jgi:hypothetical protein
MVSIEDYLEIYDEEEEALSDKPWKEPRKSKRRRGKRYSEDEWEEQNLARKRYLKEWEEDMRYAEELANEGM